MDPSFSVGIKIVFMVIVAYHALSFDVRDYVLEDEFHLLHILRKSGRTPEC